jgi:membrane protein YqaA with SNARE-associated domain
MKYAWLTSEPVNRGIGDILQDVFIPLFEFFVRNGEIGLFLYSIIEVMTPLVGVELILFPLLLATPSRWLLITANLVAANTIGSLLVYYFLARGENRFYNRMVSKKNQESAQKIFNRYGIWAILIFALTPLPFFIIIYTASIAKMKILPYTFAVTFSRGSRFLITSYAVSFLGSQGDIIIWLTLIGLAMVGILIVIQKKILKRIENKSGIET